MDLEILKTELDDIELKKITFLRRLHYQIVCLMNHKEAKEENASDIKLLLDYINTNVVNKFPSVNKLNFGKYCVYLMLKFTIEIFLNIKDEEKDKEEKEIQNDMVKLNQVHQIFFKQIFLINKNDCFNKDEIKKILFYYCKIMSKICYNNKKEKFLHSNKLRNKEKQIEDEDEMSQKMNEEEEKLLYGTCMYCMKESSVMGIGRIEHICEQNTFKTFTSFDNITYKQWCSHFIAPMNSNNTEFDIILANC